jgi:hypothetical protein
MCKNSFSHLLNVHNVSDVWQTEACTAEPDSSHLETEIVFAHLEKHKLSGSDQIPTELIQADDETLVSVTNRLINSIWNKEELPNQ